MYMKVFIGKYFLYLCIWTETSTKLMAAVYPLKLKCCVPTI